MPRLNAIATLCLALGLLQGSAHAWTLAEKNVAVKALNRRISDLVKTQGGSSAAKASMLRQTRLAARNLGELQYVSVNLAATHINGRDGHISLTMPSSDGSGRLFTQFQSRDKDGVMRRRNSAHTIISTGKTHRSTGVTALSADGKMEIGVLDSRSRDFEPAQ